MDTDKNAYDCTGEMCKRTNSIRKSALNGDWETAWPYLAEELASVVQGA